MDVWMPIRRLPSVHAGGCGSGSGSGRYSSSGSNCVLSMSGNSAMPLLSHQINPSFYHTASHSFCSARLLRRAPSLGLWVPHPRFVRVGLGVLLSPLGFPFLALRVPQVPVLHLGLGFFSLRLSHRDMSSRPERPDLLSRAAFWRVGPRSGGIAPRAPRLGSSSAFPLLAVNCSLSAFPAGAPGTGFAPGSWVPLLCERCGPSVPSAWVLFSSTFNL